jgi:hypothetical protein
MKDQMPAKGSAPANKGSDILTAIEAAITQQIEPAHQEKVAEYLMLNQRILYDEEMHAQIFNDIQGMTVDSDPQLVAIATMGLIALLADDPVEQNERIFPIPILVPLESLIMVDLMQFMQEAGMLKPDVEFIGNAFEELYSLTMQKLSVGPGDLDEVDRKRNEINPADPMADLERADGMTAEPAGIISAAEGA